MDEFDEEDQLDALVDYLKSLPRRQGIKMANMARWAQAQKSYESICKLTGVSNTDFEVREDFGTISVQGEFEILEVSNMKDFYDVVDDADNFEIYPLADGRMRMSMIFYHAFTWLK